MLGDRKGPHAYEKAVASNAAVRHEALALFWFVMQGEDDRGL